jgi:hypothetical protein
MCDSSVGVATSYGLEVRDSVLGRGKELFLLHGSQIGFVLHPANSLGVKRPGCEGDHSHTSSAEVKKGGATPSLPHKSSWRGT